MRMIVRVSDIAGAHAGLVLSRKEAGPQRTDVYQYRRLTLRALGADGYIESGELQDFFASEPLGGALFTTPGTVAVRLCSPLNPVLIGDAEKGLLVPSQLAVLTVKDSAVIMPAYLRLCLAQNEIQKRVQKMERGTAQRTVKLRTIMELQIAVPDLETQERAVKIDSLGRSRERMYLELIKQERLLTESMVEDIIKRGISGAAGGRLDDVEKRY